MSDEDERTTNNPMVATFQDDLDSSDDDVSPAVVTKQPVSIKIASADVILSSDEEDESKNMELSFDDEKAINSLTQQFNQVSHVSHESSGHSQSSEDSDEEVASRPVILTHKEELSDNETQAASRTTFNALVSNREVVLTDDDEGRPTVMNTEQLSSEEDRNVSC